MGTVLCYLYINQLLYQYSDILTGNLVTETHEEMCQNMF